MKMNYFVLGTNNMEASIKFYDSLFEQTEFQQTFETERMSFWQGKDKDSAFIVAKLFNEEPGTRSNGTMVGLSAGSIDEVKHLHQKALQLGGTYEGEPDPREPRFSAYIRDLDRNKIIFPTDRPITHYCTRRRI